MIYLDNSASSINKPDEVVNALVVACRYFSANPGRSSHSLALRCARMVASARKKITEFVGLSDGNIIFTDNCTGALNLATLGFVKKRCHIITSIFEHNALLRPLFALERANMITLSIAKPENSTFLTVDDIIPLFRPDTALVAIGHISNVTGAVAPLFAIGQECRRRGITFLVDGAQSVGFCPVDMDKNNIDMLAIAPHKSLRAITGVGVLAVRNGVSLRPIKFGGTGYSSLSKIQPRDIPDGFESGTLPTAPICALLKAVERKSRCLEKERLSIVRLSRYFYDKICKINGVKPYCSCADNGIISFNIGDLPCAKVAEILSEQYDIATRSGLHCAPLIHQFLNTGGTVRISIGCTNTISELDFTLRAIGEIASS